MCWVVCECAESIYVTGFHITRLPHTKSNLRFYQKWIAGLIHYHISHCTSFSTGKSGFCSSFLPTLSKP